jgi:hypothetical protein
MEALATYIAGLLAYNLASALVLFAIVGFSRRKERSVTPLRGVFVFLIAWLGGTILVFLIHLLFALGGTPVEGGQLETPIAILVILPVTYAAHMWLSQAKVKVGG